MVIQAVNVLHLPKFEYFQLPEASRPAARQAVMDQELKAFARDLAALKDRAKRNIDSVVSDAYNKVHALVRRRLHLSRLMADLRYFERHIDGNVCTFLEDGTYVTYNPPVC